MPTEQVYGLLVQIPLVAAFVWFTLALIKGQREHEKSLQEATHKFIDIQNTKWEEGLEGILNTERERRKEAMDQGLREVNTISIAISKLADALALQTESITRHDQAA